MKDLLRLLFAVAFAGAGVWSLFQYIRDRRREFVSVTGCVVDMERKHSSKGDSYAPVYEYYFQGQTRRRVHNVSTGVRMNGHSMPKTKYPVGSKIPLLVDQNEPGYALVDDSSKHLSLGTGLLFLACGAYFALSALGMVP